eukprot:9374087-Lingulodinium_polyedra.AAC.1
MNPSIKHSHENIQIADSNDRSTKRPISQPIRESTVQPVNQSADQAMNQLTNAYPIPQSTN